MIYFVKLTLAAPVLSEEAERLLRAFMKNECEKIREKWERKQRNLDLFLRSYEEWLNEDLVFDMIPECSQSSSIRGRPQTSFENSSKRTKKRKVQQLLTGYSQEQLTYAAQLSVGSSGRRDAANLMQEISTASPRRATTYKRARKLYSTSSRSSRKNSENRLRLYTAEEQEAFFNNSATTAQITGLDENLIKRFGTILAAIASGYEIDPEKFQQYCAETRRIYLDIPMV